MKIYFKEGKLFVEDGTNLSKHNPTQGIIKWGVDEDTNLIVTLKSKLGLIVEAVKLSDIKTEADAAYTQESFETMLANFFVDALLRHTGLYLTQPEGEENWVFTALSVAGDWYDVQGTFELSEDPDGFAIIEGVPTYLGPTQVNLFTGSSDVKVDKNTDLSYGLFVNNETEPRAVSLHTFSTPNAYELMAISKEVTLDYGDKLYLRAKASANTTKMTPADLNTVFWGSKPM